MQHRNTKAKEAAAEVYQNTKTSMNSSNEKSEFKQFEDFKEDSKCTTKQNSEGTTKQKNA